MRKFAWIWYVLKVKIFWFLGLRLGLILPYELSLIARLRTVYYGGLAASVILLVDKICNGQCYDRATLISLGMEEFELVDGSVRGLELYYGKNHADHRWVESDGWVYDTSLGLRVKKWLFYLMETPKVRQRKNKAWCIQQEVYQDLLHSDIEKEKYVLPLFLPQIELLIPQTILPGWAAAELALFKEAVNYEGIKEEIRLDMIAKGFM